MISRIVKNLLKTEKRVTVPALGSFMRRADGTIVFTEMFKDNDGVLVRHVAQVMSLTPLEATEDVARFVEHTERELLSRGIAELSDLGILTRNAQGNITFVSNSSATYQPEQPATQPVKPAEPVQEPKAQVESPTVSAPLPTQKVETNAPRTTTQEISAERNSAQRRRRAPMPETKQRDWVLIIAIAAAVFAAISMLYGILNSDVTSTIIL